MYDENILDIWKKQLYVWHKMANKYIFLSPKVKYHQAEEESMKKKVESCQMLLWSFVKDSPVKESDTWILRQAHADNCKKIAKTSKNADIVNIYKGVTQLTQLTLTLWSLS